MKTITIIFFSIFISNISESQFVEHWIKTYNGPGNYIDEAVSLAIDDMNNVYVAGSSYGMKSLYDFAVIKYNVLGQQQWVSRFNGSGNNNDIVSAMTLDHQGNIYVTGISYTSAFTYDYATIKYNSDGVRQWATFYNGTGGGTDFAQAIGTDDFGNVYVTGYSYGGSLTSYEYATIKYNSSGVQQWVMRYNGFGNGSDEARSIAIDGSQNVFVTGKTIGNGTVADFATLKYNASGVLQWAAIYNGPGNEIDIAHCVKVDVNNNVVVTGYSRGTGGSYDYATVKYDSDGNQLWVSRFNGAINGNDIPTSMALDNTGSIYVTGVTNSGDPSTANYATVKYNSSGANQWTAIYNGPGNGIDSATCITIGGSGEVFVTGKSMGIGTSFDFATIQYNANGTEKYISRFNSAGNLNDVANYLRVDSFGNTFITGIINGNGSSEDFGTIKYGKMVGVNTASNSIPEKFNLYQNYPNPFNPNTIINYELPVSSNVELKVYNVLGNEIATIVNEKQNAGSYNYQFSTVNYQLSSGIYYYTLKTENFTDTKKMILIK